MSGVCGGNLNQCIAESLLYAHRFVRGCVARRTDVGLDLAYKTDFPSWGYMAAMNATTVWEHWEYASLYPTPPPF